MPLIAQSQQQSSITLEELVERLDAKLDPRCHDSMLACADDLKALANNRSFLSDIVVRELKDIAAMQKLNNYSPQVIVLHLAPRKSYFLRANIWPSLKDNVMRASGESAFFYHKPHDHNFNFLTVGYHGPGYWSDYYEYDYDKVAGYPGESMGLRFVERSALTQGKVMLYRAFVDVHDQLPPDELSISLNIMENTLRSIVTDQYAVDTVQGTVKRIINRNSMVCAVSLAAAIGDANTMEVIDHIARTHPSPRLRFNALKALGSRLTDPDARVEILMRGLSDDARLVQEWSRHEIARQTEVLAAAGSAGCVAA